MNQPDDQQIYVGVMTGTSIDGLDIAAIRLTRELPESSATGSLSRVEFVAAADYPLPSELRDDITTLARNSELSWQTFGRVDAALGDLTGKLVNQFLHDHSIAKETVRAIGSHGQTVHHSPDSVPAFTVQIGDASRICEATGLQVVSDFRRADIAAGGQGAPLVPAFHEVLFARNDNRARSVCNIGGIANVTLLPAQKADPVTGFDTGPGNTLLDAWCKKHNNLPYDANGAWGATGKSSAMLLSALLGDPYVQREPPKSTGVEHYNLKWLEDQCSQLELSAVDVQATLTEFTARTIVNSVRASQPDCSELIVCGGGRRNLHLMNELTRLSAWPVVNCDTFSPGSSANSEYSRAGINGDALEAAAFAWLASQTLAGLPGNVPSVTGARKAVLLGTITQPS